MWKFVPLGKWMILDTSKTLNLFVTKPCKLGHFKAVHKCIFFK
jgi:hypothetical protein